MHTVCGRHARLKVSWKGRKGGGSQMIETATLVTYRGYTERNINWSNAVEEGQRGVPGQHPVALTRHGLASNARRKHRRNEPGKTENLRRSASFTTTATAAPASTPPVVPVGGGVRRRRVRVVGTARHSRHCESQEEYEKYPQIEIDSAHTPLYLKMHLQSR